ncbi:MAG: hypothetical protein ACKERG_01035 [Candidatus Hodgkinia cicadicola]
MGILIRLVDQRSRRSQQVSLIEAQTIAQRRRLSLIKVDCGTYSLVDAGKQKYLEKKAAARRRLACHVVKKRIEIKSNIGGNDLEIKLRTIQRFLTKSFRVNVAARFLRTATAPAAYAEFVTNLKLRLLRLERCVLETAFNDLGEYVFYLHSSQLVQA